MIHQELFRVGENKTAINDICLPYDIHLAHSAGRHKEKKPAVENRMAGPISSMDPTRAILHSY